MLALVIRLAALGVNTVITFIKELLGEKNAGFTSITWTFLRCLDSLAQGIYRCSMQMEANRSEDVVIIYIYIYISDIHSTVNKRIKYIFKKLGYLTKIIVFLNEYFTDQCKLKSSLCSSPLCESIILPSVPSVSLPVTICAFIVAIILSLLVVLVIKK